MVNILAGRAVADDEIGTYGSMVFTIDDAIDIRDCVNRVLADAQYRGNDQEVWFLEALADRIMDEITEAFDLDVVQAAVNARGS